MLPLVAKREQHFGRLLSQPWLAHRPTSRFKHRNEPSLLHVWGLDTHTHGLAWGLRSCRQGPSWPSIRLWILTGPACILAGTGEMTYGWIAMRPKKSSSETQNSLWLGRLMTLLIDLFITPRTVHPE